jgi:hypothetical protein
VHADLLFFVESLFGFVHRSRGMQERLKINKEEEELVDVAPQCMNHVNPVFL